VNGARHSSIIIIIIIIDRSNDDGDSFDLWLFVRARFVFDPRGLLQEMSEVVDKMDRRGGTKR
jgi:hypothetical protein